MTTFPPAPLAWQNKLALDYSHSQIAYVGYEGTIFHLSGPFAPVLGSQTGVVIQNIAHLDAPFKHLDNKGARQDGITWYDTLYEPAEIDIVVELGGMDPKSMRSIIAAWLGAWDPKQLGKLCWFSPERGEWWCNVRMNKPITDQIKQDWYQSRQVVFTWSARNDDAFWQSVDSVSTFTTTNAQQNVNVGGDPTGGTFTLTYGGVPTAAIPYNADPSTVQSALQALSSIGSNNVTVTAGNMGGPYIVTFVGSKGQQAITLMTATSSLTGGTLPSVTVNTTVVGGQSTGFLPLTNIGDQPAWPRYLCYGPGSFSIGDGPGATNMVTFGPLLQNQVALLDTLPRRPAVLDVTPNQPPNPANPNQLTYLLQEIINFVTNNNVPPLLQQFESLFGIAPPQGPLYSLLNGRFTTPIPPMLEQQGPQTSDIPCRITGGNSQSKIIAALTPFRRWPE